MLMFSRLVFCGGDLWLKFMELGSLRGTEDEDPLEGTLTRHEQALMHYSQGIMLNKCYEGRISLRKCPIEKEDGLFTLRV